MGLLLTATLRPDILLTSSGRVFPPARLPINLVYPSRRNLPLRVRIVIDYLVAAVRDDPLMASSLALED